MLHRPKLRLRHVVSGIIIGVMTVGADLRQCDAEGTSSSRHTAIVRAVSAASPSVVNIHGRKQIDPGFNVGDSSQLVNGMGTGVVIDERGYVLTNFHVIDGVGKIQVTLSDRRTVVGELVAHDPKTDLAIIRIAAGATLPVIRIGTSSDLMPGESVIAVGNAYGYEHTVTRGIISALHRTVQVSDDQKYFDLIQTDASINPGNSGGPLLNIDGEMIGINVAVRVGAQGIGFAIPIDEALEVAGTLLTAERIDHLTHGLEGKTVTAAGAAQFVVDSVLTNSPAEKAGFRAGDIVTSVAGKPVVRRLDFERALIGREIGEEVEMVVDRAGQSKTLAVVMDKTAQLQPGIEDRTWKSLGIRLANVPASVFRQYNTRYRGGLRVTAIRNDGPAAKQGIRRGDILVGMHKWETISLDNVSYILGSDEFHSAQPFKFYILRGSETLYGHMRAE